jgi:hypothetical protein
MTDGVRSSLGRDPKAIRSPSRRSVRESGYAPMLRFVNRGGDRECTGDRPGIETGLSQTRITRLDG